MIARLIVGLGVLGLAAAVNGLRPVPAVLLTQPAVSGWAAPSIPASTVVARVHHETVTWSAVEQRLEEAGEMGRPAPDDAGSWRAAVSAAIESIVGDVLTRHVAEAAGFTASAAMIDAAIEDLRARYGGDAGLARAMAEMRVSMAELRETQQRGLYSQALIDRLVVATDLEIDEYLAHAGTGGLTRDDAAARIRAEKASSVILSLLAALRADPEVWVIPIADLERTTSAR